MTEKRSSRDFSELPAMNETSGNLIADELAKAGTDPELLAKLRKDRITSDKELPPMDFLMRLFGVPCCPRGELVAFTGKAKSGKTFVMSMLMAAAAAPRILSFERNSVEPLSVLWIDTEQSDQSTQDILRHRLMPMVGAPFPESLYDIFNIRIETWEERLPLVMAAIDLCHPDLVILDGIRDLVDDINDGRLAHDVVEKLMRIAQAANCCIASVIHQNKAVEDKTLRGSIGTELTNKAFEVYECEKLMPSRTFVMTQKLTRKYDIETVFYYTVDDQGLPQPVGSQTQACPTEPLSDVRRLFTTVLIGYDKLTGSELRSKVMESVGTTSFKTYADLLAKALSEGVIRQWKEKRLTYYALGGPA